MVYNDSPPYDILQNDLISFAKCKRWKDLLDFGILFTNSGISKTTALLFWRWKSIWEFLWFK